jgi:two-component system, cell cycle response regulator DivK
MERTLESGLDTKQILLCDDNMMNRKLITAFLHGTRYHVIETDSGHDCINRAISSCQAPDLILLDIGLKDISGSEVCQILRSNDKLKQIPIIAYTARAMADEHREYLDNGFTDILTKPIVKADLMQLLNKYLS